MTKSELLDKLDHVNHTREKRGKMAALTLGRPEIIPLLLEIAFESNGAISDKAIWVIEYTIKQDLDLLLPYLDTFTKNLPKIVREQSIRPTAKMCELLLLDYYSKTETKSKNMFHKNTENT